LKTPLNPPLEKGDFDCQIPAPTGRYFFQWGSLKILDNLREVMVFVRL
jgi:hypothetical protein